MTDLDLTAYARDPVAFIDAFIVKNELGQPFALMPHQRDVLRLMFAFDADGLLAYDTFVYSAIKKSGKTTIDAAITTWWAFCHEAPNELKVVGNDQEQSVSRTFSTIVGILKFNPVLGASATVFATSIRFSNGSTIDAIANDYAGESGANHGYTSWTELWGNTNEASRRLWEELTPVPTRKNSIRVIDTYAGFEGESDLLEGLYKLAVDKAEHPDGKGQRVHASLPVFANADARIIAYWDHVPRMPWQTPQYYASQRRTLRPSTYLRLHENRWTSGASIFITPELYDPCVDPAHHAIWRPLTPVYVGVDCGVKHDNAAVVAVTFDGQRLALVSHRLWKPTAADPLDIEATIENYLRELHARMDVANILVDPYQLHRTITTLRAAGLPINEFPQTTANTTLMGQTLFDALKAHAVRLYPDDELRAQALHTVAIENPRGWRIAKEKSSKKIDAIVALAMGVVGAVSVGAPAELMLVNGSTWQAHQTAQQDAARPTTLTLSEAEFNALPEGERALYEVVAVVE